MPPRVVHQPVGVLRELPRKPALADTGRTHDRDEPGTLITRGGVEEIPEQVEVVVAADEWRLQALGPIAPTELGNHAHGAECGHRQGLALERLVTNRLEGDRLAGRALG